jgi:hypothetical protein
MSCLSVSVFLSWGLHSIIMRMELPMTIALYALIFPTIQIWSFRVLLKFHHHLSRLSLSP